MVALPFGKFKGQPLNTVMTSYLRWLLNSADNLDPWLRWHIQREPQDRGERFLPAAAVLSDLEELIAEALDDDWMIDHEQAGLLSDCVLVAFERLRQRHGTGSETELVTAARRPSAERRAASC